MGVILVSLLGCKCICVFPYNPFLSPSLSLSLSVPTILPSNHLARLQSSIHVLMIDMQVNADQQGMKGEE